MKLADDLRAAGWTDDIIKEYSQQAASVTSSPSPSTANPAIRVNSLTKKFGHTIILQALTFTIYTGEIFGIVGRSGAGKSTLLQALAGLTRPDKGKITCEKTIGLGSQQPSFYPELSVLENLRYYGRVARAKRDEIKELTDQLGLRKHLHQRADTLSGGLQKKLDLAIAFLGNPEIMLLDEPTPALHPLSPTQTSTFLSKRARGRTIVIASHQLSELEPLCKRIAIIHNGKLVALGTPDQFRERIGARYLVRLEFESHDYSDYLEKHPGWNDGNALVISANTQEEVFKLLRDVLGSGESIVCVSVEHPSLRHLFSTMIR